MTHSTCRVVFLICIGVLLVRPIQAQILSNDILLEKLNLYAKANPSDILFVHTDKTVYTNNETIWFSAYLVKSEFVDLKKHIILSVAMVSEDSRKVNLQFKYAMQDGLSFGSLSLPDSIPPGNYQFIAATNILDKNNQPLAVFTQSLTIKSITQQNFNATLELLDTIVTNGSVRAKVTVGIPVPIKNAKSEPSKASIEYSVSEGKKRSVVLSGNSYIITIPTAQLNQTRPVLLTSIKYNKIVQHLSIKLPEIKSNGINIRFFPEGGNLVAGLESTIAWESVTTRNLPVNVHGILYKDDLPIDTIRANSYGVGTFRLKPDYKSNYTLKVTRNSYLKQDTIYTLPKTLENGMVMHVPEAIVNDTLRIELFSRETRTAKILIHNYRESYASVAVKIQPQGSRIIIPLMAVPKGIATVTILDEEGRPLAERLFFAHYGQKITVSIHADKPVYSKRDSVQIKLELTDQIGKPQTGIVSIAVVQDNRIESSKFQDIESYTYLNDDLGALPQDPQGIVFNNKVYLENILMVKGWRRYTWQSLMNSTAEDTIRQTHSSMIRANVLYKNKPLKKPIEVSIIRDSQVDLITTETDGSFILDRDKLLIQEGRRIVISVNQKIKNDFNIHFQDPFIRINQLLAGQVEIVSTGMAQITQSSTNQQLQGLERMIVLPEVTIGADNSIVYGSNACGDYVCYANILNCRRHFGHPQNHVPIKGETYFSQDPGQIDQGNKTPGQRDPLSKIKIVYQGCGTDPSLIKIPAIYYAREFYGLEKSSITLSEPQFLSTLFWKPGVIISDKTENKLLFFTGDITGPFRIVVQGIGEKDVVFGEDKFIVK